MICFLFVFATESLTPAVFDYPPHGKANVFYRKKPPAVASASTEVTANKYLAMLDKQVTRLQTVQAKGSFTITGAKSFVSTGSSGAVGTLLTYYRDPKTVLKAFISGRTTLEAIKETDLQFFADLYTNREGIFGNAIAAKKKQASVSPSKRLNFATSSSPDAASSPVPTTPGIVDSQDVKLVVASSQTPDTDTKQFDSPVIRPSAEQSAASSPVPTTPGTGGSQAGQTTSTDGHGGAEPVGQLKQSPKGLDLEVVASQTFATMQKNQMDAAVVPAAASPGSPAQSLGEIVRSLLERVPQEFTDPNQKKQIVAHLMGLEVALTNTDKLEDIFKIINNRRKEEINALLPDINSFLRKMSVDTLGFDLTAGLPPKWTLKTIKKVS